MIILGIDPGYAIVGYGVIESNGSKVKAIDYGVIKTPADLSNPKRLKFIEESMAKLISLHKPDAICIEEIFFHNNQKTAINVAQARGAIVISCIQRCSNLFEYTPLQIKQAMTGYGRANKQQIQQMVKVMLELKEVPKPDDAADALAVALTHSQTNRLAKIFGM